VAAAGAGGQGPPHCGGPGIGNQRHRGIHLSTIAAAVDRLGQMSDPTMELLEASRAIHNALVFLSDWSGGVGDEKGVA
jgi:hypothetical protein